MRYTDFTCTAFVLLLSFLSVTVTEYSYALQQDAKKITVSAYPGYSSTVWWPVYSESNAQILLGSEGPGSEMISFESEHVTLEGGKVADIPVLVQIPQGYDAAVLPPVLEPVITATHAVQDQPIRVQLAKTVHITIHDDIFTDHTHNKTDSSSQSVQNDGSNTITHITGEDIHATYPEDYNRNVIPYVILAVFGISAVIFVIQYKKYSSQRNSF